MSSQLKLILIDGTSFLYRAFFAIKELSTSSGESTNAVFGFIRMLRQIQSIRQPTHWAVVFDGGLPEERTELLPDYKAQRPSMPDNLVDQIGIVEDYLDSAEVVWVRREGEEADDVIASIAEWALPKSTEVLLATSDKDLYQLVNDKVKILPGSGKGEPLGADEIRDKTGVGPDMIVEWLALVGDSSDNIPGVPGVGPKTAARLLNEHGSIENLLKNVDAAGTPRVVEALRQSTDIIARNVKMVRLRRDLTCPFEWGEMEVRPGNADKLLALFERLEFTSMARELRERDLFNA
jgi:DNA polymerase-1